MVNLSGTDRQLAEPIAAHINELLWRFGPTRRVYRVKPVDVAERNLIMIRSVILPRILAANYGITPQSKLRVPEIVWRGNEACVRGYLRGLFQADGTVQRG